MLLLFNGFFADWLIPMGLEYVRFHPSVFRLHICELRLPLTLTCAHSHVAFPLPCVQS